MNKLPKTNAMRALEVAKIEYSTSSYEVDESDLSGVHAAKMLNIEPEIMFKTLVTKSDKGDIKVFVIPVNDELDLKKCATVSKEKRVELIAVKELLPLTGYVRGGCSPIGMKKKFPTFIDETAILFEQIYISAGVRGVQIIVNPVKLKDFLQAEFVDLTK
ncbi:MAG: Cys-tRNA(Pro) deacylase [Clostridia bacterium]|nr:Cys-tRNA(Pro) deacylase [Clostridia bacterium]